MTASAADPILRQAADVWSAQHLRDILAGDASRCDVLSRRACGIHADFSRHKLDINVMQQLLRWQHERGLEQGIRDLFAGAPVNGSEGRPALHMALRAEAGDTHIPETIRNEVLGERRRQRELVDAIRADKRVLPGNERITSVLVCGIGGSDLGARLVLRALRQKQSGPRVRFAANPDELDLRGLVPQSTLLIIVSKSFGTVETRFHADRVLGWFAGNGLDVRGRVIAVTANAPAAAALGVAEDDIFPMWDWVGGRFSLWSSVGLPIALGLGWREYAELLAGAREMDLHFAQSDAIDNLPLALALIDIWNRDYLGSASRAVISYSQSLELLLPWLQQLEMESNGKSAPRDADTEAGAGSPVVWGGVGTRAQHAIFQALHQGRDVHPVELVLPIVNPTVNAQAHDMLVEHCLAQGAALALGQFDADPARNYPGDRPSTTLLIDTLDAHHLGALLACYEHRTFAAGWLWGLNPFDQWGVELGKTVANRVGAAFDGDDAAWPDTTSRRLGELLRPVLPD